MTETPHNPIRIFLLEPQALVRAGLRLILESQPGMHVVGEAGSSSEALEMIHCQKPDIVLLELDTIGDIGLELIPAILRACSHARPILVTSSQDTHTYLQVVQAGALGVVSKAQPPEVLIKAIEKVHAGEVWVERSMIANLLTHLTRTPPPVAVDPEVERIARLSARERQVVQLIGQGLKNQQIAAKLCISTTTVRHHLTAIFRKLEVSDRLELLVFAHRSGLTKTP
jgi:DNA-binding NarL/FixJ family response regulator